MIIYSCILVPCIKYTQWLTPKMGDTNRYNDSERSIGYGSNSDRADIQRSKSFNLFSIAHFGSHPTITDTFSTKSYFHAWIESKREILMINKLGIYSWRDSSDLSTRRVGQKGQRSCPNVWIRFVIWLATGTSSYIRFIHQSRRLSTWGKVTYRIFFINYFINSFC